MKKICESQKKTWKEDNQLWKKLNDAIKKKSICLIMINIFITFAWTNFKKSMLKYKNRKVRDHCQYP